MRRDRIGMAEEGWKEDLLQWAETLIFHMHSIPHSRNYKGLLRLEGVTSPGGQVSPSPIINGLTS